MFEDFEIGIHCPKCDAELEVRLSQIKHEDIIVCPQCRTDIHMKPDETPGATDTQT